jgi:1-acyl-sn-glycerol-3-phosphate acyltransferase
MSRDRLRWWLQRLFRWLTRYEFQGLENIPPEGGVIIATNHMSRLDIPFLFINPVRPDITALVADKYLKYAFFRWFAETAGGVWLDRSKADFSAFRETVKLLKDGRAVGIAPEGTRSNIGELLEGKPGTLLLADRAGVPIVPVGIAGTEDAFKKIATFRRPKLVARFGPAFTLPPIQRDTRDQQLADYTDELMLRIAATLPEKYWGYYKNHPRLKEFVE